MVRDIAREPRSLHNRTLTIRFACPHRSCSNT
jgi:hypothetical protein